MLTQADDAMLPGLESVETHDEEPILPGFESSANNNQQFNFEEDDGGEWFLDYGAYSDNYYIDNISFFRNSLGIAVSISAKEHDAQNAIVWRADRKPESGKDFWKIVDQLLLYF